MFAQTKMDAASRAAEKELEKLRMTVIVRQRQEYRRALDELRSLMAGLYEKHATDGVLTYSQMTQYNRLKSLYANIKEITTGLYDWEKKQIPMLINDSFEEAYFRYGYTFQAGGMDLNWGVLNPATIKAATDIPISGLPVSDILTKNNYNFYLKARQEVTQGLIQGESIDEMSKRIQSVTEVDAGKAELVARTESTRAAGQGHVAAYDRAEKLGVEIDRIWIAMLDRRTRDAHAELDGQKADEEGLFHIDGFSADAPGGFGDAAMDCNCRCTIIAEVKDFPSVALEGHEEMTYDKWVEQYR
jgi:SPP1 gp7 family putative phage head morphogenesis protein